MKLTLGQVADVIHAEGDFTTKTEVAGYSIDSRTVAARDLYFAVKGERLDGHDFVEAALSNGAAAAVVSMRWLAPPELDPCKLLRVPDHDGSGVLDTLQQLAQTVRRLWGGRVIGVTGSAGKTTTKEMVAAVLAAKFRVLKSAGNLNNGFGVPLQLLRLEPEHEVAVIEMGMNHAGEIAALAKIAEPNWAVVSNVAAVHLEHFPEGIAGIAAAKRELVEALPPDGLAFLNADDVWVREFGRGMGERAVLFGTREGATVRAMSLEDGGLGGTDFELRVSGESNWPVVMRMPGRHTVLNALAAIAVGLRSGVSLLEAVGALERMRPTEKRGNRIEWNEASIYNDTYNSNPAALESMVAALKNTEATRRIVVAGEMLELGPEAAALHAACGRKMAGIDVVVGVRGMAGALAEGATSAGVMETVFVETPEDAGAWMKENLRPGDVVLLKGSRGVRLERALAFLEA